MMGQSRLQSMIEALVNVFVGFWVSVMANVLILPLFGAHLSFKENLLMGWCFTVISIVRSYLLRRAFNWYHVRQKNNDKIAGVGPV